MGLRQKIAFHQIFVLRFQRFLLYDDSNLNSKKIFSISQIILVGNEATFFVTENFIIISIFILCKYPMK